MKRLTSFIVLLALIGSTSCRKNHEKLDVFKNESGVTITVVPKHTPNCAGRWRVGNDTVENDER